MKTVLALETSTAHASVSIVSNGQVLSTELSTSPKTHSEFLNPAVERCLAAGGLSLAQIDIFACGSGPGSFTGLRVAASIAKTFSMTFQRPLVVIDSLTLLMSAAHGKATSGKILCLINAYKNMTYTALFNGNNFEISPCALTIQQINELDLRSDQPVLCVGEGFMAYEKSFSDSFLSQICRDSWISDHPHASTLGQLALVRAQQGQTIEWNLFEPLYIRASEAEENQRVKSR